MTADGAWHLTGPAGVTFTDVAPRSGARYVNVPPRLAAAALRRRGASPFEIDHSLRMAPTSQAAPTAPRPAPSRSLTGRSPRTLDDFFRPHSTKGS